MTFNKIAYISSNKLIDDIQDLLPNFQDDLSIHYDCHNSEELWIVVGDDILSALKNHSVLTAYQVAEIKTNNIDTLLIY